MIKAWSTTFLTVVVLANTGAVGILTILLLLLTGVLSGDPDFDLIEDAEPGLAKVEVERIFNKTTGSSFV